jgi:hypothetical protein
VKRAIIRKEVMSYLERFYLDFMLYKEQPVISKLYRKAWAMDMYEQLSDDQRYALYLKLIKKNLN